jgi:hypothetical protein
MIRKVLVIDVGGTHVKILATGQKTERKLDSGKRMTAARMCKWVKQAARDWQYDVVAIGYPGPVIHGRPVREPFNLGKGWVSFDYSKALGRPVKMVNDAAMQAIGSYVQRNQRSARMNETPPQTASTSSRPIASPAKRPSVIVARSASLSAVSGSALMKGWAIAGKFLVGKEDAGENPHRHHDQVDEAGDAFDFLRAASGQQTDSAEATAPIDPSRTTERIDPCTRM